MKKRKRKKKTDWAEVAIEVCIVVFVAYAFFDAYAKWKARF